MSVDLKPTSTANTPLPLPPHTDRRGNAARLQMLHCLVNTTTGGLSTMADGRSFADSKPRTPTIMRRSAPSTGSSSTDRRTTTIAGQAR